MKQIQSLLKSLVVCATVLAMVSSLAAQETQGAAKVVRVRGPVRFTTGNNVWLPLKTGATLKPGTVIETLDNGQVDLALGDANANIGSGPAAQPIINSGVGGGAGGKAYQPSADQNVLRLYANSVLAIDKLTSRETGAGTVTDTQLDLQHGKLFGNVKKVPAGSNYEIKLPIGMAGIRGTIYTVSADGVVQVLVGTVVIAYMGPNGQITTVTVVGGQQFDARTGQVTPIPNFDQDEMVRAAKELRIGPNTPPTTFTLDNTIYFVSPTQGHNGNNGANGPLDPNAPHRNGGGNP
jgi:hypothetical protein